VARGHRAHHDGTVIDAAGTGGRGEATTPRRHHAEHKYDAPGFLECSQDVWTYLRHWINLHSCRLGLAHFGEVL